MIEIYTIRADNGTEFKNKYLNYLCLQKGIKHQFSVVCCHQQIGTAERVVQTILSKIRIFLKHTNLPKYL